MNKVKLLREDKRRVAIELFEGRCFCCHRKVNEIVFQFHHLEYLDGEKAILDRLYKESAFKYWEFVKPTIYENPDRFMVLCRYDHKLISLRTKSEKGKKTFIRLLLAVLLTK
jgi:hypothetical protein